MLRSCKNAACAKYPAGEYGCQQDENSGMPSYI